MIIAVVSKEVRMLRTSAVCPETYFLHDAVTSITAGLLGINKYYCCRCSLRKHAYFKYIENFTSKEN